VNATLIAVSGWVGLYRRSVYVRVIDARNEINCIPSPMCSMLQPAIKPREWASDVLASSNKQIHSRLHKWHAAQNVAVLLQILTDMVSVRATLESRTKSPFLSRAGFSDH